MVYLILIYSLFAFDFNETFRIHFDSNYLVYDNDLDAGEYIDLTKNQNTKSADLLIQSESFERDVFLLSKTDVLLDSDNRISNEFNIPKPLKKRVGFWLDIYTKYDSDTVVLHDRDYPWVIYEAISVKKQMKGKGHYWTRYHRAQRYVKKRRYYWKGVIKKLAKRKNIKNLSRDEKKIYRHFKKRKYIRLAAKRLRSQTGQKDHFMKGLDRASPYLAEMEQIFYKNNLPYELTRLPLVESSFNTKAESKVGAKGVWQIMPNIGRKLKLIRGKKDKRSDVIASTHAAAKLFKEKFRALKKWPLTVTAYNHGPSGVKRAMRKLRTTSISKIVSRYDSRRFGFASQNFYASFLAALYAERYQEVFFNGLDLSKIVSIDKENKAL